MVKVHSSQDTILAGNIREAFTCDQVATVLHGFAVLNHRDSSFMEACDELFASGKLMLSGPDGDQNPAHHAQVRVRIGVVCAVCVCSACNELLGLLGVEWVA